jgi:hypothetical protein
MAAFGHSFLSILPSMSLEVSLALVVAAYTSTVRAFMSTTKKLWQRTSVSDHTTNPKK